MGQQAMISLQGIAMKAGNLIKMEPQAMTSMQEMAKKAGNLIKMEKVQY